MPRRIVRLATFLISCLLLPAVGHGVQTAGAQSMEYFVDSSHPSASDSNPGSESLPWRTIQKAANSAGPGATVYVKSGVYDERVILTRDGLAGARIVFQSLPRRTAQVLHGFQLSADYIRLEGFDITHNEGGWMDGGIWMAGSHVEIVDNSIHHVPGTGIQASWEDDQWRDVRISGNRLYHVNMGIVVSGENWVVEENEIERLVRPAVGGYDADYVRFFGINHLFRRNLFHGTLESEIGVSHVDYFQSFNNNGELAQNIVIEYNQGVDFAHQAFMIESDNGTSHTRITIRHNVFQGQTAWGICAENIRDLAVYNNTWLGNGIEATFHGVGFNLGSTGGIYNNIFAGANTTYFRDAASMYSSGYNLTFESRDAPDPGAPTDLLDTDPLFVNGADVLGPDGLPWTWDDGLRITPGSPAAAGGQGGTHIGAYPYLAPLELYGQPGDGTILLRWRMNAPLPPDATWRITYSGPEGSEPSPINGIDGAARSRLLSGLANDHPYLLTLEALSSGIAVQQASITVIPTGQLMYLPFLAKG